MTSHKYTFMRFSLTWCGMLLSQEAQPDKSGSALHVAKMRGGPILETANRNGSVFSFSCAELTKDLSG